VKTRIAPLVAVALLALGLAAAPSARAVPLAGDYTLVDVTSVEALADAGLALTTLGSAEAFSSPSLDVLLALFPVTGGDVDLPNSFLGFVEHQGSGLRLSFLGVDLDLENFVIDTVNNVVNADVSFSGSSGAAAIFRIVPCASGPRGTCQTVPDGAVLPTGFGLRFTEEAALLLETAFGLQGFADFQFGVANTALRAIPEPGTLLLLGAGLTGLAALGRRRA